MKEPIETPSVEYWVNSPQEMAKLGRNWAQYVQRGRCMHFEGDLGAGKTTLIQEIFNGLNVTGPVLSPTFSIMETYTTDLGLELLHMDLYRIEDPDELLLIGLDELEKRDYAWFIEWPQRGGDIVPSADMRINISYAGNARKVAMEFNSAVPSTSCS